MKYYFLLLAVAIMAILGACRKDDIVKSEGVKLSFSADTVFLDTVFSSINSSTYTLKVYNPTQEKIVIDNIRLEKGEQSPYRININGTAARDLKEIEILKSDSIYIFIEVTAPVGNGQEFLLTDRILFFNKGTEQHVDLVTTANDAYFHFPNRFILAGSPPNQFAIPYSIIKCDDIWNNDKPHVVYGYAVVDEDCKLTINPGSKIYFHKNSGLWIFDEATLNVAVGSSPGLDDSVVFSGDRLEPFYEDVPGQWGGLLGGIFIDGKARATINLANIKNAQNAIRVDSAHYPDQLKLYNSYILNTSRTAIYGGFGSIDARNVVVANAGLYGLFAFGGNYQFRHCTFANYWNQSTRTTPVVYLSNYFEYITENSTIERIVRPLESAYFGNCIIYGNNNQELQLAEDESALFNYTFANNLFKLHSDVEERGFDVTGTNFTNSLINLDPRFMAVGKNNYDLDSLSQAIGQGNNFDATGFILDLDIKGRIRNLDGKPDLGAFERQN